MCRASEIGRSEEHTSELQSHSHLVCRLLLEKKKASDRSPGRTSCPAGTQRSSPTRRSRVCSIKRSCVTPPWPEVTPAMQPIQCFFFKDTATPKIYTLSLNAALPF